MKFDNSLTVTQLLPNFTELRAYMKYETTIWNKLPKTYLTYFLFKEHEEKKVI
jgi:hypothetical protein